MVNGLEIIGSYALNGTLDKIELPETVKEIGDRAFAAPEHHITACFGYIVKKDYERSIFSNSIS